jgi:hypothetical protein
VIDDESLVKTRTNTCLSYASAIPSYSVLIMYMKKFLNSYWLRALQFFSKYSRCSAKKMKYSANFLIFLIFLFFNFLNFLISKRVLRTCIIFHVY